MSDWAAVRIALGKRRSKALKQNLIFVRHIKGRTKKIRIQSVPLNESAREAILSRTRFRAENCPDNPWVFCRASGKPIKSVKRSFNTACKNAEIENYRIHDQRHTLASWMIMKGIALAEVRDMLGHIFTRKISGLQLKKSKVCHDLVTLLVEEKSWTRKRGV